MTKYREILRLCSLGLSQQSIADSCGVSKKTVNRVLKRAKELNIHWPLDENDTDAALAAKFFPSSRQEASTRAMPNFEHIRKELMHNGVSKKLLWMEYMEDCKKINELPLMYSQFCYYVQQYEQKHRASMHIKRNPAEQIEVDWAGDVAHFTNPETGKPVKAYVFVGVLSYSQYAFVEAFMDMKQKSWISAHVHMYEFFGGVSKILIPDNCKTAVLHTGSWDEQRINQSYQELAEHYGTAIIPARVRTPKDKPNAEGIVGNISTWIIAALRNEQFFSLYELNKAIRQRLILFNQRPFQKKEGSRESIFLGEEKPYLAPLPATRFELCEWKTATVQFIVSCGLFKQEEDGGYLVVIIPGPFPFIQRAREDALVLASDVACHTQPHARWQVAGKVGNELIVAVRRLDENLRLTLALDAPHHFLEAGLARMAVNRQITLEGKALPIEARGHQAHQDA